MGGLLGEDTATAFIGKSGSRREPPGQPIRQRVDAGLEALKRRRRHGVPIEDGFLAAAGGDRQDARLAVGNGRVAVLVAQVEEALGHDCRGQLLERAARERRARLPVRRPGSRVAKDDACGRAIAAERELALAIAAEAAAFE
jgi:hypothetical protein